MIPIPSAREMKHKFTYTKNVILPLRLLNMWPNTKKKPILYHLEVWFVVVMCTAFGLSCSFQILKDYKDFDSTVFLVDSVMVTGAAAFRFVFMYINRDKFLILISQIHDNFIERSLFRKKNRASILKHYNFGRNLCVIYTLAGLLMMLQMSTVPLLYYIWETVSSDLNDTEHVPYPIIKKTYAPFDYEKQPGNAFFYIFQTTSFIGIAWIYMMSDSFWYMVIIFTTAQLVLLKDSVNTITNILKGKDLENECELLKENEIQNVTDGLSLCIRHHKFLREFMQKLDELSNLNMLMDSLHAVISLSFVLLDLTFSIKGRDTNEIMFSLQNFVTLVGHIFLYDWLGNELTTKEEELAEAIYDIPWYKCPSQKSYIMLMSIQARRPSKLTGGKLFTLSLEFFSKLMQAAFSYFTFFLEFSSDNLKQKMQPNPD